MAYLENGESGKNSFSIHQNFTWATFGLGYDHF